MSATIQIPGKSNCGKGAALEPLRIACAVMCASLIVAAGIIDARRSIYPHQLWAASLAANTIASALALGVTRCIANVIASCAIVAVLVAFELYGRHRNGTMGIGAGDLKFLCALGILDPWMALVSFACALLCLSVTALATKQRRLPLLPFWTPFALAGMALMVLGV